MEGLLQKRLIEPAGGAWSSSVVLVKKKDGTWRMFGIASTVPGSCGGSSQHIPAWAAVAWIEEDQRRELEALVRRVRAEGGQVLHERRDESGACTHAVIQDPVGVHLALIPG